MEIVTEPTIPKTPTHSEPANSGQQQQSEISGAGAGETESSKSPTPDEKTEEKQRILVPKNGSMDGLKVPKSPSPCPSPSVGGKVNCECKTPTTLEQTGQRVKFGGIELPKNGTPNRLKLPKAFKYPERYTSPTDLMMSPISKGLLARTRKGAALPRCMS